MAAPAVVTVVVAVGKMNTSSKSRSEIDFAELPGQILGLKLTSPCR